MKKTLFLLLILSLISLSGCAKLEDAREKAHNTLDDTKETLTEAKENLETAVDKVDETIQDTKEANKKIREAKEAVDAITE